MKKITMKSSLAATAFVLLAGATQADTVLPFAEHPVESLQWQALAPGAPEVTSVWGDPKKGPYGLMMRFKAGNLSGPHIHTLPYNNLVISGTITNPVAGFDEAPNLPAGSHWMQPGGQLHETNCMSESECVVLITQDGPLDTLPASAARDVKDPPVFQPITRVAWYEGFPGGNSTGSLWGDRKVGHYGMLMKFPAGFKSGIHTHTGAYNGVVVRGVITNPVVGGAPAQPLHQGSWWYQPGGQQHETNCSSEGECVIFIAQETPIDYQPITYPVVPGIPRS
jgi:anti-sigma factor ChrR (cupin superfamily)